MFNSLKRNDLEHNILNSIPTSYKIYWVSITTTTWLLVLGEMIAGIVFIQNIWMAKQLVVILCIETILYGVRTCKIFQIWQEPWTTDWRTFVATESPRQWADLVNVGMLNLTPQTGVMSSPHSHGQVEYRTGIRRANALLLQAQISIIHTFHLVYRINEMTTEIKCHVLPHPEMAGSRNSWESTGYTWRQTSLVI
jgi:hypothetical protein